MKNESKNHYIALKSKWLKKHRQLHKKIWIKHKDSLNWLRNSSNQWLTGSIASLILLTNPITTSTLSQALPAPTPPVEKGVRSVNELISNLKQVLPSAVIPLTSEQEAKVAQILTDYFHLHTSAELEGIRLNRSYGLIGAEQHLMRYPGDTIETHFRSAEEATYRSSGMAPGRGAWGYFTSSGETLTEQDIQREKYYIAVQTFLSPGWSQDIRGHYNFFKYRKMLVVNPQNGKAVVAVIGDAGPGESTGKHLGGSPEVMAYLERKDGRAKGPVLYFFINDPFDKVPLGPIESY